MLYEFDEIDSTNKFLKDNYENIENYSMAIAKHQTRGRGRINRNWYDDSKSLLASIIIKNVKGDVRHLSLIAAYAIFNSLKKLDLNVKIKWPNDIYVGDEKICGILIETILSDEITAIIGFGVNTNIKKFPSDIKATSISIIKEAEVDNLSLAQDIKKEMINAYENVDFLDVVKVNRENSYLIGKEVMLNYYGDGLKGVIIDLLDSGNILLDTGVQKMEIFSGEINLSKKS